MKYLITLLSLVITFSQPSWSKASDNPEDTAVQTIIVGSEGTMKPFTYRDENGHLTGFDVEVAREIGKRDPSLNLKFTTGVWDTLFPSLDAGHIHVIANQIAKNADREARYQLTNESYFKGGTQIIILKARENKLTSFEDLRGKTVGVGVGSNHARVIEDWNAANNNAVSIRYYDGEISLMFQDLANYRIDAMINSPITATAQAKANQIEISFVGDPIYDAPIYFVFQKSDQGIALQQRFDHLLKEMIQDGTLTQLSLRFFDQDFTK